METISEDMAQFLWAVLQEPVLVAIAAAALYVALIGMSTWFYFMFKRRA